MKNIGIYVHIPFCMQKCKYCDFISYSNKKNMYEDYFNCVLAEIEEKANNNKIEILNGKKENIKVDTIYIGGGTPSIVDVKYIELILNKIKQCFKITKNAEVTIEINPGTCDEDKLRKYFEIGINRISIGLQSTNDNLLNMLGRIHNYKQFENTYNFARAIGFKNINVDLMIGLPKQTIKDVEQTLNKIIKKCPEHISVYSLIVEENTKMYELIESGDLVLPSEGLERNMYWKVKNILERSGYKHYEISNFSKPTFESKHNLNCWKQHSYLGMGVSAHSYFGGIRFSNIDNLNKYIENYKNNSSVYNIIFHEKQDKEKMMKEFMLLGLRRIDGVDITEFKDKFSCNLIYIFRNELNKLVQENLVEVNGNIVKLTKRGIDVANQVWMEFIVTV